MFLNVTLEAVDKVNVLSEIMRRGRAIFLVFHLGKARNMETHLRD